MAKGKSQGKKWSQVVIGKGKKRRIVNVAIVKKGK